MVKFVLYFGMTTAAIRERLHDYISAADDKQIKAIYTILEDKIVNEPFDWSKDEEFVAELDERVRRYEAGIDKGHTWEELEASIAEMKKKRSAE
jgi:hypothetical protein